MQHQGLTNLIMTRFLQQPRRMEFLICSPQSYWGLVGLGKVGNTSRTSLQPQMYVYPIKKPLQIEDTTVPASLLFSGQNNKLTWKQVWLLICFTTTGACLAWSSVKMLTKHGSRLTSLHTYYSLAELQDSNLHLVCTRGSAGGGFGYFYLNSDKNVYMHQLTTLALKKSCKIKKSRVM